LSDGAALLPETLIGCLAVFQAVTLPCRKPRDFLFLRLDPSTAPEPPLCTVGVSLSFVVSSKSAIYLKCALPPLKQSSLSSFDLTATVHYSSHTPPLPTQDFTGLLSVHFLLSLFPQVGELLALPYPPWQMGIAFFLWILFDMSRFGSHVDLLSA